MSLGQRVYGRFRDRPDGLTLDELEGTLALGADKPGAGVVECILRLSGHYQRRGDRWLRRWASKMDRVKDAIAEYAESSGRSVFRAESALRELPPEEKPTREELASVIRGMGGFTLLKNDMIKAER